MKWNLVIECSVDRQNLSKWHVLKYGFDIIFQKKNHSATSSLFHQKPTTPLHYYTIILIYHSPLTATYSPLKTHDSRLTSNSSIRLNRVLDTNFTFFKSKIHSNWHVFKLTSHGYVLTSQNSRLTTHQSLLHHYTNLPLTATYSPLLAHSPKIHYTITPLY